MVFMVWVVFVVYLQFTECGRVGGGGKTSAVLADVVDALVVIHSQLAFF